MRNIFDLAFGSGKKRKAFPIAVKRMEWLGASGNRKAKNEYKKTGKFDETVHSKCRMCGKELRWGTHTYDFDHKNNTPSDVRQSNCVLYCTACHRAITKAIKVKERDSLGIFTGRYKTKMARLGKVGYKKPKSKKK